MAYTVLIRNNTLRMHEYTISPLGSESETATRRPQAFKLRPGAENPNALPRWDDTQSDHTTIQVDSSQLMIKATTEIITKEGFLPLSKESQVNIGAEELAAGGSATSKTVIIEHKQVMVGNSLKGGGIETEFVIIYS